MLRLRKTLPLPHRRSSSDISLSKLLLYMKGIESLSTIRPRASDEMLVVF